MLFRIFMLISCFLLVMSSPVQAQDTPETGRRSRIEVALGLALPIGFYADQINPGSGGGITYIHQPLKFLYVELGGDAATCTAKDYVTISTTGGTRKTRLAMQYFFRAGGGLTFPISKRLVMSAGAGLAFGAYEESIGTDETITGWHKEERSGMGPYYRASLTLLRDRVSWGISAIGYEISTSGDTINGLFLPEDREGWMSIHVTAAFKLRSRRR